MRKIVIQLVVCFISLSIVLNVNAEEQNGWVHEEGSTYYYENNQKVTGYKTIDNEKYFFKETGVLQNNIVFLGDSITQGYNLKASFNNYPVINSGISGNTTRDVLNDMYGRVYQYNPSKVVILIGTNDIFNGISKEETISNINKIINNIKEKLPNTKIYLESLYPINNSDSPNINHWMVGSRTNSFITSINNEIKKIEGITYINMYDSLVLNGLLNLAYTYDGLHMNSTGYNVITNKLTPYVEENDNSSNIKDKWYYLNNRTYYYENNEKVLGTKTINGKEYNFDSKLGYIYLNKDTMSVNSIIWLDYPNSSNYITDSLNILGWFLTRFDYIDLEISIDNVIVEDIERSHRQDVLNAYPKYENNINDLAGYSKNVNIGNLSYGKHILKIELKDNNGVFKTKTFEFIKRAPKTKTNIDYPLVNEGVTDNLRVLGWAMSTANTTIKAYIDNQEVTLDRTPRGDVLKVVTGYGDVTTNPTPGFAKNVDITNLPYGKHTLKIDVLDTNNNLIQSTSRSFNKIAPKTKTNLDYPLVNEGVTDNLRVLGWVMSSTSTTLKAYVDNQEVILDRAPRGDVLNAIKGYGDITTNPTPGFAKNVDITNLSYGTHTLRIDVLDLNNSLIQTTSRNFIKTPPKTKTNIDYPLVNEGVTDNLRILGWVMSSTNTTLKAYVDNQEVSIDRAPRGDVLNAVKGYGDYTTNPTPGFAKNIDITNLSYGTHTLRIDVLDLNNSLIQTTTRSFNKTYPKTLTNIDYPILNQELTDNLRVLGWVMSTTNTTLKAYIDNQEVSIDRFPRGDVLNAIKGYGDIITNPTPGFDKTIDITTLTSGTHTLKIEVYDTNNLLVQTATRQFIKK